MEKFRKDRTMMNTVTTFAYLDSNREQALLKEQGLNFICFYKVGRKQKTV